MELKLNDRQKLILELLRDSELGKAEILESLKKNQPSQATLSRDLLYLLEKNFIKKSGQARATKYRLKEENKLFYPIDIQEYFSKDVDQRSSVKTFNLEIFNLLKNNLNKFFTGSELKYINELNKSYLKRKKKSSKTIIQKELERLTIELSWKSSKIEGNTYTLLDTETLIKSSKEAPFHTKQESIMILNHKKALDYIFKDGLYFKHWSLKKIRELHRLLTEGLDISSKTRSRLVRITGTNFEPLDNQWQIEESLESLVRLLNQAVEPISKALLCLSMLAYIQAFEDGNKRTSRIAANACLIANNYCPLSFRSVDEDEYKKAILLFYEQNNLSYLKSILIEQFEFASNNYFC